MKSDRQPAYILGSSRTPFVKSQTSYSEVTRKELMVAALNGLVERFNLKGILVGDTALGAVMNSSADFNLARECILDTELHPESPAVNIQRACGTSLEAVWQIGMKLHTGAIDIGIAGGVDTNSDLPIEISKTLQGILLRLNKARTLSEKIGALKGDSPRKRAECSVAENSQRQRTSHTSFNGPTLRTHG